MKYWVGVKNPINTGITLGGIASKGPTCPEIPGIEFLHTSTAPGWGPKKSSVVINGSIVEMLPARAAELIKLVDSKFVIFMPDGVRHTLSDDPQWAGMYDRLSKYVWIIAFNDTPEERVKALRGSPLPESLSA